jgi:hypothetical protein
MEYLFTGGKFNGVKVLKGVEGSSEHGLPESSHSSFAYLNLMEKLSGNVKRK